MVAGHLEVKRGIYQCVLNYTDENGKRKRQSILRKEIEWMQRGARARSTKQKAHIQRYEALRDQEGIKETQKFNEEIEEVKTKLEDELLPTIQETILPVVEKAATQDWVKEQGYLTEHQSLAGYATEEFVTQKITEAELADKDIDLGAYYTKSEVDALIPNVPVKVSELENDAGYVTAADIPDVDLSTYYTIAETKAFVSSAVSGLASKKGLAPANKVGVVDSDYRGEVMVALHNHSNVSASIDPKERIAQLVITPYIAAIFNTVESLDETVRGEGGFGSTGSH